MPTDQPQSKKTLRIDELAREWDVSRRTVERLIEKGQIDAFKIGHTVRIKNDTVKDFEQKNNVPIRLDTTIADFREHCFS